TISNASLQLPVEGQQGYVAQPKQQREWTVASIAPGATWFPDDAADPDDDFIVVPEPTGEVNLEESFITQAAGSESDERLALSKHPQVQPASQAPRLEAKRRGEWIVLKWEGKPGSGYQAYGAADRKSEFTTPLPTL